MKVRKMKKRIMEKLGYCDTVPLRRGKRKFRYLDCDSWVCGWRYWRNMDWPSFRK